jgi:hypothetical protein
VVVVVADGVAVFAPLVVLAVLAAAVMVAEETK